MLRCELLTDGEALSLSLSAIGTSLSLIYEGLRNFKINE